MDTITQKFSYGCVFTVVVSIILLAWHDVSFFHYNNDEISDILASVLSWWQISIISNVILFCICVYKSIKAMTSTMNTRFGDMDTRFGDMDTRFDDMDTRFGDRFDDMDTRFDTTDTRFGDMDTRFDTTDTSINTGFEQMQKLLGAMLGGVKPDVSDPGEMLRQFKKTFMKNIILVSKTGQEKADIQKKADIVFTWLNESQFSVEDISTVDLGIEGNALELLVRGGHMDHALNFGWEKCSLTVLPYIAQEYDNMLRRGHINLVKGVLDLCKKDIPREDVAKKSLYMAASTMIYTDYEENIIHVGSTNEWVGIRQCLKDIHLTLLKKPISHGDARDEIRKHTLTVPDKKFNLIFERIFG